MREVYAEFLTEEEIQSMMHNKDIWMDSEEVVSRLSAVAEKHAQLEAQAEVAQE